MFVFEFAGFSAVWLVVIAGIVLSGGLVKGIAGFGYAIASTAVLATLIDPSTAVVVVIVPMMAANLSLVRNWTEQDCAPACNGSGRSSSQRSSGPWSGWRCWIASPGDR
jgi:hypothetical protein